MAKATVLRGTYRITIKVPGTEPVRQIICGNNYKFWWDHAREYIFNKYKNPKNGWNYEEIKHLEITVEYAENKFVDDGGLKWCGADNYQEVINEVFYEYKEEYVPNYATYQFNESKESTKYLIKKLKEY